METVLFMSEFSLKKARRERFYTHYVQKLEQNKKDPLFIWVLEVTDSLYNTALQCFSEMLLL